MHEAGWTLAFLPRTDRHLVLASHNGPESCVTSTGKREAGEGVPQGSSIGPLLANIYLDYAFDLWARAWRHRQARGDVIVVRFADDIVMGFQHRIPTPTSAADESNSRAETMALGASR